MVRAAVRPASAAPMKKIVKNTDVHIWLSDCVCVCVCVNPCYCLLTCEYSNKRCSFDIGNNTSLTFISERTCLPFIGLVYVYYCGVVRLYP